MGKKNDATKEESAKSGDDGGAGDAPPSREYGNSFTYDPTFNGPLRNRGCTDVICCILFIIFMLGMLAIGIFGYINGNPALLLYPADSQGNLCGYGNLSAKPVLFFFDLLECAKLGPAVLASGCPTPQVCLSSCPSTYWSWYAQAAAEETAKLSGVTGALAAAKSLRSRMICKYDVNASSSVNSVKQLVADFDCAPYYVSSASLYGRCMPSLLVSALNDTKALVTTLSSSNLSYPMQDAYSGNITLSDLSKGSFWLTQLLNARSYGERIFSDVMSSKWYILAGVGIAVLFILLWIFLMRWLVGIIVWAFLICFVGLFAFASYYCFDTYYTMKKSNSTDGAFIFTTNLAYYLNLSKTWLAFSCTASTLLLIVLLVILFLRTRILIAIALLKEGSRAVGSMLFTLLWPIWPFILQVALYAYFVAAALYLASINRSSYAATNSTSLNGSSLISISNVINTSYLSTTACDPNNSTAQGVVCTYIKVLAEYTIYLQIYNLFMLFWIMNFIIAFGQMVLAGAFASYYWSFDKSQMISFPILASLGRTLLYHTGSLAFGSLIIAIIQIIRVALEYLDQRLKGSQNVVAKFFLKCLKCCFWCLEKFMKMINKNAYILIAIYGKNFCVSAKNAFCLIMRNIIRVAVVDKVTDFILFIGKLVCVGAIGVAAFFFFDGRIPFLAQYADSLNLNYYLVPVIVLVIATFVIASCFFSVYGMAVDTLFLCFLQDLEVNDGSAEKPYYMSKELLGILSKKNKKPAEDKRR